MTERQRSFPTLVALIFVILAAASVLVLVLFRTSAPNYRGTVYPDPQVVADFELSRADGGTFRLSDYHGKVLIIYFGYTYCPDLCPTTLADLTRATERLGGGADEVQVLFVTVDPERDTANRVDEFRPLLYRACGRPI